MLDFNQARVFVEVARAGSFTGAARRLGLPKSTVSARVAALERGLGVPLLRRSTRTMVLTEEGRAFLAAAGPAIDALLAAEAVAANPATLAGTIRFTAPLEFPSDLIAAAIARFIERHPSVRFEVMLTNRIVDLVAENIDLALRGGSAGGRDMIIRRLGSVRFGLYASPHYLARRGAPRRREELFGHDLLRFAGSADLRVGSDGEPLGGAKLVSDNLGLLQQLAEEGAGIAELPAVMAEAAAAEGRLVRVPGRGPAEGRALHLAFPSRRGMTPRVRAFADHLVTAFRTHL